MDGLDDFLREAREKARTRALKPFWNPQNVGEELYGIVVDIVENPFDSTVKTYVIKTPDGKELMTPNNRVLVNMLEEEQPEIGDLIYIRYDGRGRERKGRSAPKLFSIYVKRQSEAGKETTEKTETTGIEKIEVETAEESLEASGVFDIEPSLRAAVAEITKVLGYYPSKEKFEKALKSKGFELTAKDVERILPRVVKVVGDKVKISGDV